MPFFYNKITINNVDDKTRGVFLDDLPITGVTKAEILSINPGPEGLMEVVLHIHAAEVDIQFRQHGVSRDEPSQE